MSKGYSEELAVAMNTHYMTIISGTGTYYYTNAWGMNFYGLLDSNGDGYLDITEFVASS